MMAMTLEVNGRQIEGNFLLRLTAITSLSLSLSLVMFFLPNEFSIVSLSRARVSR
jgi:hypothetical protein